MPIENLSPKNKENKMTQEEAKKLAKFHKEMTYLVDQADLFFEEGIKPREKIEGLYNISLIKNIDELTLEDAYMWEKIKNYTPQCISSGELEDYQNEIFNKSKNESRKAFFGLIIQKLTYIKSKEDIQKRHK